MESIGGIAEEASMSVRAELIDRCIAGREASIRRKAHKNRRVGKLQRRIARLFAERVGGLRKLVTLPPVDEGESKLEREEARGDGREPVTTDPHLGTKIAGAMRRPREFLLLVPDRSPR